MQQQAPQQRCAADDPMYHNLYKCNGDWQVERNHISLKRIFRKREQFFSVHIDGVGTKLSPS
jgi:hypothetical protein